MANPRLITMKDIVKTTSLSKATIYREIRKGNFPQKIKIGERRVAWKEAEVLDWLAKQDNPEGEMIDTFARVAKEMAEGKSGGTIILDNPKNRRVRMLRTDEQIVFEKKKKSE